MVSRVHLGDVDKGLIALALSRLAEALAHEIAAGKARQQPIRSAEYERALQFITGGPDYPDGLLKRMGDPMELTPRWEAIQAVGVQQPQADAGDGEVARNVSVASS